jgi:hypothetical protein
VSASPIISSPSYANPALHVEPVQSSSEQLPAQLSGTKAQDTEDVVQLSQLAQIQQMAQQGESASAIAGTTGLPVSEVDSDLGISTTSSSVPVAAPRGHGGEHHAAAAPATAPVASAPAPVATSDSKTATPAPALSVRA